MLLKHNNTPALSDALFSAPTAEYRGTPFWSWNCKLNEKELLRQIDELREMGFGGFHMHCRAGMATEYLGDEFMHLVKACVKKAKKEDMLAWLYDEDRWPSGFAGGLVTKDARYRGRYLVFSPVPFAPNGSTVCGQPMTAPHLDFGRYDIRLAEDGTLCAYRRLGEGEEAEGEVYYAYELIREDSTRYNFQAYVDTLNPEAIRRFIEVTHEAYKRAVGHEFDKTVPAIFTDEPQFRTKERLAFATEKKPICLPWTDDLEDTYLATYGESLLARLPEVIWDLPNGAPSVTRFRYHDHVCRRFTQAFADQCGAWCEQNHIALTGHMMEEPTLGSQTGMLGEAMPSYRGFHLPGIDMLCAKFELNTAKQCQSAVRQYGREGMLSELYGVTSWDFDFRGYKLAGDWQAAMGVTVRVPHLSWVSMEGEAKRDYPASIHYQSPWYKQYKYIEDHFSRLNTALTRGKPVVRIGVIHPIGSYWLHYGPKAQSDLATAELEANFANIASWLSYGSFDFDYICETTLPELCAQGSAPLRVGKMAYDVVIVPACETLRATTVARLADFRAAGGRLLFLGAAPKWMDAELSDAPRALYAQSEQLPFSRAALLAALAPVCEVEIRNRKSGARTNDLLYQMREEGGNRWLFICKGKFPDRADISLHDDILVRIPGQYSVKLYDTLTGEIRAQEATHQNGKSEILLTVYDHDSFLFCLTPTTEAVKVLPATDPTEVETTDLPVPSLVPFALGEPNALLLDMAEYALDDEPYHPREELLRADNICRERLGWRKTDHHFAQPWCIAEEPISHHIRLRFRVQSEIRVSGAMLAIEHPEQAEITWNGVSVEGRVKGYYVDRAIKTLRLPVIKKGENILELVLPFGVRTATEWCYILGTFGTRTVGETAQITPLPTALGFSNIVPQGLSFYSGAIDYQLDTVVPDELDGAELSVCVPQYRGTVIEICLDGGAPKILSFAPYKCSLGAVTRGAHRVTVRLFVPRTNGFGPVHLADAKLPWMGPGAWRTSGDSFGYEYRLKPEGVMMKPQLTLQKKQG